MDTVREDSRPCPLLRLPTDLLFPLFKALNTRQRLAFAQTCKLLHTLYTTSEQLQYELELSMHGLMDISAFQRPLNLPADAVEPPARHTDVVVGEWTPVPLSSTPWLSVASPACLPLSPQSSLQVRRDALAALTERWTTLSPSTARAITASNSVWEPALHHGYLMAVDACWPLSTDVGPDKGLEHYVVSLPSALTPDVSSRSLPVVSGEWDYAGAIRDASQDLLVAISRPGADDPEHFLPNMNPPVPVSSAVIHVLSMSTGQAHPLAAVPVLRFPPPPAMTMHDDEPEPVVKPRYLQVLGDTVAVLALWMWKANDWGSRVVPEVHLWNWKTGELRGTIPGHSCDDVAYGLITETSVLAVNYPVTDTESLKRPPSFTLWTFEHDTCAERQYTSCVAQLDWPKLQPGVSIASSDVSAPATARPTTPGYPFALDPHSGVIRVQVLARAQYSTAVEWFDMYLQRETLVDLITQGRERLRRLPRTTQEPNTHCPVPNCTCSGQVGGFLPLCNQTCGHCHTDTHNRTYYSTLSPGVRRYPWRAWSRGVVAMVPEAEDEDSGDAAPMVKRTNSVAGYRDANIDFTFRPDGLEGVLVVRDFSPAAFLRAGRGDLPETTDGRSVCVETGSSWGPGSQSIWAEEVYTDMACVETRVRLPRWSDNVHSYCLALDMERVLIGEFVWDDMTVPRWSYSLLCM